MMDTCPVLQAKLAETGRIVFDASAPDVFQCPHLERAIEAASEQA